MASEYTPKKRALTGGPRPRILFDLEGTLYNPGEVFRAGIHDAAKALTSNPEQQKAIREKLRQIYGGKSPGHEQALRRYPIQDIESGEVYERALNELGLDHLKRKVNRAISAYRRRQKIAMARQGKAAVEQLKRLKKSHEVYIFTRGEPDVQRQKVMLLGLHEVVPTHRVLVSLNKTSEDYARALAAILLNPDRPALVIGTLDRLRYGRILTAWAAHVNNAQESMRPVHTAVVMVGDREKYDIRPGEALKIPQFKLMRIFRGKYAGEKETVASMQAPNLRMAVNQLLRIPYYARLKSEHAKPI